MPAWLIHIAKAMEGNAEWTLVWAGAVGVWKWAFKKAHKAAAGISKKLPNPPMAAHGVTSKKTKFFDLTRIRIDMVGAFKKITKRSHDSITSQWIPSNLLLVPHHGSIKKITRGAEFQKIDRVIFTHPDEDHGIDFAFYTSAGSGVIGQCKYYV